MKNFTRALSIAAATGALLFGSAYAADVKTTVEDVQTKVYKLLDKDVDTIKFSAGSATLSDAEASSLRSLAKKIQGEQNLDKIVVASWSDKEYPATHDAKLDKLDRDLADQRNENVKKALKDAGVKLDVDTYSMAEHPTWIAKTLNTDQAKLKGEGHVKDTDDRVVAALGTQLRSKGGPGKSVVIVKHKDKVSSH